MIGIIALTLVTLAMIAASLYCVSRERDGMSGAFVLTAFLTAVMLAYSAGNVIGQ